MPLTITCHHCHGKGTEPLPEPLAKTLAAMPRGDRSVTAQDLQKRFPGVTSNAQNNRLEKLRALGLVKRERAGKFWRYSRAAK